MREHAAGLAAATEQLKQVEAVRDQRLLLEADRSRVADSTALADALRKALLDAHAAHEKAHAAGIASLAGSPVWQRLSAADRTSILASAGLTPPAAVDASSDASLLAALDAKPLSARQAEADAVAGRVQKALEQAARLLEPKVRPMSIERATLRRRTT